jgi:hypothetical protein
VAIRLSRTLTSLPAVLSGVEMTAHDALLLAYFQLPLTDENR